MVLTLMLILALFTTPYVRTMFTRAKMMGAGQELISVLRVARLEAIKRNVTTVVQFNFNDDSLMAYADVNDGAGNPGSDKIFDPPAAAQNETTVVRDYDYVITTYRLPGGVHFWGAPDNSPAGANAIVGLTPNPAGGGAPNLVVFKPDGSIQDTGQVRLGLGTFPRTVAAKDDTDNNFLAAVVRPQATARVYITKYNPMVKSGDASKYFEPGTDPATGQALWQWY